MKRWHNEEALMNRRLRLERMVHSRWGSSYEDCHCYGRRGLFRKRRPLDISLVWFRRHLQHEARQRVKRWRREPVEVD